MLVKSDCPHCGRLVIEGSKYCLDCGSKIIADRPTAGGDKPLGPGLDTALAALELGKLTSGVYLLVIEGIDRGLCAPLAADGGVVIGRAESGVALRDPFVSRRHAEVEHVGDRWYIRDLTSANCTFVNSRPIERHELVEGDIVEIGYSTLLFHIAE